MCPVAVLNGSVIEISLKKDKYLPALPADVKKYRNRPGG
jgi:hypothetical protein